MNIRTPSSLKGDGGAHAATANNEEHVGNPFVICRAIDDTEERVSSIIVPQAMSQTPPTRRIPCRARGLVKTHNKQTAYFEIPYNAPHGMVVRCSRPECYGTDRGFRYCIVCKRQVAQRNFLNRHGHGIITTHEQLKEAAFPALPPPLDHRTANSSSNPNLSYSSALYQQHLQYHEYHEGRQMGNSDGMDIGSTTPIQTQQPHHPQQFRNLSHSDQQWISLLHDRPPDEDSAHMEEWRRTVAHHPNRSQSSVTGLNTVRDDRQQFAPPSTIQAPPGHKSNVPSFTSTTSSTSTAGSDTSYEPYQAIWSKRQSRGSFQQANSTTASSITAARSNRDTICIKAPSSTAKDDRRNKDDGPYNFFERHFIHDDRTIRSSTQAIEPIDVETDYGVNFLSRNSNADDFSSLFD